MGLRNCRSGHEREGMNEKLDKIRSIGCLLAGMGLFLIGLAAVIVVFAASTVDVGSLLGLKAGKPYAALAGAPCSTNVVSIMLSLATNVAAAAESGGDPLANLDEKQLENVQRQLLDQLSDPAKMTGNLNGVLSDPAIQKQAFDLLNSDFFKEQLRQLTGGMSATGSGSTTN